MSTKNQENHPNDVNRGNQLNPDHEEYGRSRGNDPADVNRGNQLNPDHEEYHNSREENDN